MQRHILKVLFALLLTAGSAGLGQQNTLNDYYGNPVDPGITEVSSLSFASTEDAEAAVKRITDQFGLSIAQRLTVRPSIGVSYAAAVTDGSEQFILYNPAFMSRAAADNWVPLAILAHEIGHHYNRHLPVDESRSPHELELEADRFSGFALARLGATLEQAQAAVRQEAPVIPTASHPARAVRLIEIERGWQEGRATMSVSLPAEGGVLQTDQEAERGSASFDSRSVAINFNPALYGFLQNQANDFRLVIVDERGERVAINRRLAEGEVIKTSVMVFGEARLEYYINDNFFQSWDP